MTVTQEQILKALSYVQDPDLKRDIVSLGFIQNVRVDGGRVAFTIELTTPACPVRDQMKEQARAAVQALPGVSQVEIAMTSQVRSSISPSRSLASTVKNIIPIASGKGGVGKSTVSANLALALARTGARVGLMDADVYGPSIPTILGVKDLPEVAPPPVAAPKAHHQPAGPMAAVGGATGGGVDKRNRITPVTQDGLRVISMGFFMNPDDAVIWRGPMLHKTVEQFLGGVEWGELDYLILDMPPGTGDVQLSLCQLIPITGAVIVSTPQDVALNVAQKAIAMFKKLNAPILGIIENMSAYVCPHCGTRDDIFGEGGARKTAERLGIPFLGEIPLATPIRVASDAGKPIVLTQPDSPAAQAFIHAAENLAAQVSIRAMQGEITSQPKVTF